MSKESTGRAWVEVDLDALRANFDTVRRRVGAGVALIPMVKANAYGIGVERAVRALEPLEPWAFGVAAAAEGWAVRRLGIERPVIVFSPLPPQDVEAAARARLSASVSDLASLDRWAQASEASEAPLDFHVEVDTGMGRAGFDWRAAPRWAPEVGLRTGPRLRWRGVFTHFQGADAPGDEATAVQWERFQEALAAVPPSAGDLLVHAANSAAALRWPARYGADAVRPGIFLYGGDPAPEVEGLPAARPVVSVRARVVRVQEVPEGWTVGYGATYAAEGVERWATLAVGYGDGLPRALGNGGEVLVRGRRAPMIGRMSMDLTVVDVSGVPEAEAGDVATIVGRDGSEEILLEHVAARADTIGYEILTRLGGRLPRIEVGSGGD